MVSNIGYLSWWIRRFMWVNRWRVFDLLAVFSISNAHFSGFVSFVWLHLALSIAFFCVQYFLLNRVAWMIDEYFELVKE